LTDGAEKAIFGPRALGEIGSASDREEVRPASSATLQDIIEHTRRVFDGREALAQEWLCSPNPALGDDVPLMRAATEQGTHEVRAVLGRLEHGVFS
jgi:uncharacterized protein (DUF2384 family)